MMFRRMCCLLMCALLALAWTAPASSEAAAAGGSYDFDLTFSLNAAAFPELQRTRVEGYAALVSRLGLRGTVSWSTATQSADLEATLYYTDNPSLSFPLRLYGTQSRIFFTSPLINNEIILLNMTALMEFSMKARNTLGVPLAYAALLYPYATLSAFEGMARDWQSAVGTFAENGEVTPEQFRALSELWADQVQNNGTLDWWISGLASGSDAPSAVEAVMNSLPYYGLNIAGEEPVSVTVAPGSRTWRNAAGETLFSREEADGSLSLFLSLPAEENGYVPFFSFTRASDGRTGSFDTAASLRRDPSATEAYGDEAGFEEESEAEYTEEYTEESEEESEEEYRDEDDDGYAYTDEDEAEYGREYPDLLLDFRADGSGLPLSLPADGAFTVNVGAAGALYPDFALIFRGETKKDGAVTLSLNKLPGTDPAVSEIFRCTGTFLPAASPKDVPDYMREDLENVFNVFSINEQKIPELNSRVLSPLIRNLLSFVAAAPTAACQSFLDDLTDIGVLDILVD